MFIVADLVSLKLVNKPVFFDPKLGFWFWQFNWLIHLKILNKIGNLIQGLEPYKQQTHFTQYNLLERILNI